MAAAHAVIVFTAAEVWRTCRRVVGGYLGTPLTVRF